MVTRISIFGSISILRWREIDTLIDVEPSTFSAVREPPARGDVAFASCLARRASGRLAVRLGMRYSC